MSRSARERTGSRGALRLRWLSAELARGREALVSSRPWALAVAVGGAATRHRITGTAAEMAFFAVLALVPLTVAFGAALASVAQVVGPERIAEGRDAAIVVLTTLIGPELTADTVAPFVRTQLTEARGGLALGGLLVALWLGSRMFMPALHALDLAYEVEGQRSALHRRLVSLGLAVASLTASAVTVVVMVVGPLLGIGRVVAVRLGLADVYRQMWTVGRWPLLVLLVVGFLVVFYRFGPSIRLGWRSCLPGALVGMVAWVLVALGFRLYLAAGGRPGAGVSVEGEVILTVGRAVGAVVATMLWVFLSSVAILLGGEVNGALRARAPGRGG